MPDDRFDSDRLEFTSEELLTTVVPDEPLIANGVRCHGGFDSEGQYFSPRTRYRRPAILNWQDRLKKEGEDLIEIPLELIPPQYPNAEQSKVLLQEGVRDPIVRALTMISIVEGFGAIIRDVEVPDLESIIVEPIDGTALAHLRKGLFEAHARDEAGHKDEGGHKQMWEAARDVALENPKIPGDVLMSLMGRRRERRKRRPLFPELDPKLERMISLMGNVLVVEVFAENTFEWGEQLLGDPEVSASPETAGGMVAKIRSDEKPHVEYLRTALSELRARTLRTVEGKEISGRRVVDAVLHRALSGLTMDRPREQRDETRKAMLSSLEGKSNRRSIEERFDALQTQWTPPALTGFEPAEAEAASE